MPRPVHAHIPYPLLRDNLAHFVRLGANPEVFFSGAALDALIPEELAALAATISDHGLATTIHAPFMDLNPGSSERLIREATRQRLHQVLDAAALLKPKVIVFHPGYDRWRYGEQQEQWLKASLETWGEMLPRLAELQCVAALENVFDEEPEPLRTLLEAIDSPHVRHCFDIGHWQLFHRVGLEEWFAALGPYMAECHIHDNRGLRDDHAPIGFGVIDFPRFFTLLAAHAPKAVWTIEAHSRDRLERALAAIAPYRRA